MSDLLRTVYEFPLWSVMIAAVLFCEQLSFAGPPVVIAHRGASGYAPEHTLVAKAMAHAMGADYIEQDVVLTKDDQPIVLHDIHLDSVTNVVEVFPTRLREDGRYYAVDFTLDEIRRLTVTERFEREKRTAVYPGRFPLHQARFQVPTLAEEIELIQGLNKSTGRQVGIYPEIKAPAWHRQQGKDISRIVLAVLDRYGYREPDGKAFVQCFDASELKRIRHESMTKLKLVQLIGENDWNEASTDFEQLRTPEGVQGIAAYADGIGPSLSHVVTTGDEGRPRLTSLVQLAHQHGLVVHPYTFRVDAIPDFAEDFDELLDIFLNEVRVDGLFTDFPDRVVQFREHRIDSR